MNENEQELFQERIDQLPIPQQIDVFANLVEEVCDGFIACVALGNTLCQAQQDGILGKDESSRLNAAYKTLHDCLGDIVGTWNSRSDNTH